jgi:UDP-N-acetylglucosamine:LPS N-acetylglucosamine transferase
VEQPSTPEGLRELIDEALEEIERTELEMLDLLADVLGPQQAERVADQIAAQSEAPRFDRLLGRQRRRDLRQRDE